MENNKKTKGTETGGILFALFLLLLGAFALLFDVSPFTGLLRLLGLWPVLFIGIGIWLVFKNLNQEKVGVVVLAAILLVAMYSVFSQSGQQLESFDEKDVPSGVTKLNVSMDLLFGSFTIGSTSDLLYASRGVYYAVDSRMSTVRDTAHVNFSARAEAVIPFRTSPNEYEILLNQRLPVTIVADSAMSSCSFDLSDLKVEEFILDGGVSSIEITFGEANTTAVISMGVSSVKIYVPESVGVKIISEGLLSLSVPPGWIKTENGYESPNYDTATYKVSITCDIGMGTVNVAYT